MLNINKIIGKFIKNSSQREIDKLQSIVKKINDLEAEFKKMPDKNFPDKTNEFKSKIKNGQKLEDLIPETFDHFLFLT
jgi:preprotein translocase subunit SecA